jgi:hypothetical protein
MTDSEQRERESQQSSETKYEQLGEEEEAARHERIERLGEEIQELKERADAEDESS